MAYRLAQLLQTHGQMHAEQAQDLGIDLDALTALDLCRMPREGEKMVVVQIAGRFGLGAGRLVEMPGLRMRKRN